MREVLSLYRVTWAGLLEPGAVAGFIGRVHAGRAALATGVLSPIALNLWWEASLDGTRLH